MASEIEGHAVNIGSLGVPANNGENRIGTSKRHSFRSTGGRVSPAPEEEGEKQTDRNRSASRHQLSQRHQRKKTIFILIQVLLVLLIMGFMIASLVVNVLKVKQPAGLKIWKWCLFSLSVLCGFALVYLVYWPIIFLVERVFLLDQEVIFFIYGLRKSGAFLVWWIWVLLMWLLLVKRKIKNESEGKLIKIATRTIASIVIASCAWVLTTIGLRLLAVKCRFHRYIARIQEAAFGLDVLKTLYRDPEPPNSSSFTCCGYGWLPSTSSKEGEKKLKNKYERFSTFKSKNVNFLNWSNLVDNIDQEIGLTTMGDDVITTTKVRAKEVASAMFHHVIEKGDPLYPNTSSSQAPRCITKNHLKVFFHEDDIVNLVLEEFNVKEAGQIDEEAFTNWVLKAYQDRKILSHSLKGNKTATRQLDFLLRAMLVIVGVICWLLWIDILTTALLAAFLTSLAGAAFIFKDLVKTMFQSIIYIFVVHPFDIGDRCIIEGSPEQMVVEEMNILTTTFLKPNNEHTYYPNPVLSGKVISNLSRSPLLSDCLEFYIDFATPIESIGTLKENIKKYLESNSECWSPTYNLVVEGIDGQQMIKIVLHFSYKNNAEDTNVTKTMKDTLLGKVVEFLNDLKIEYSLHPSETGELTDVGNRNLLLVEHSNPLYGAKED